MLDQANIQCKWDNYVDVSSFWMEYITFVKRGNTPLINCPIYMKDVAESELQADGLISKRKKDDERQKEILRNSGLIK